MYRLLIVDDEPIIANALFEVFQNIGYMDLDVCKAYSGAEAIELLMRSKVDFVITDIRMPEMDGIELLGKIRASWPQCKIIMLTGYNEFDYVYQAIQHKGVRYLLKTEGYNKIIKTVENMVSELDESLKLENIVQNANEQMALATSLLQKDLFVKILNGKAAPSDFSRDQFQRLGISLDAEEPAFLLMGRFDSLPSGLPYTERIQYLYSVRLIAEKYFLSHSIHVVDENENMIWLLQPEDTAISGMVEYRECVSQGRFAVFIRGMIETVQAACRETIGLTISFSMCNSLVLWKDVAEKYIYLNQLLAYKFGSGTEMLLIDSYIGLHVKDAKEDKKVRAIQSDLRKMDILQNLLERGQREEYFKLLEEFCQSMKGVQSMHYNPALEVYYSISVMLLSCINRWNLSEKIAFSIGLSRLTNIGEHVSWDDAIEYIKQLSTVIFNLQTNEKETSISDVIIKIQNYIHDHIHEELSLVQLSEQVFFNPSYLSRLYKQSTGENLWEYIIRTKIEKAKLLLEKPEIKIHEVGERIGYCTGTNFTRFFKKIEKITPQQYRDMILKK